MAFPTAANNQITDTVASSNIKVYSDADPGAVASLLYSVQTGVQNPGANPPPPTATATVPYHPGFAMVYVPYAATTQQAGSPPPSSATAGVVNPQITDAVTQANLKVIGEAPAMAMGTDYQTMAHAVGMAMSNAANTQHQANVVYQAATAQGVVTIYSIAPAAGTPPSNPAPACNG